jgi:hypothetical protein
MELLDIGGIFLLLRRMSSTASRGPRLGALLRHVAEMFSVVGNGEAH